MQLQLTLAILLLASGGGGTAAAGAKTNTPAVQIAGTYSDIRYIEEAGDLLGLEVKIIPLGERFQAAVLVCEGSVQPMRIVDVRVRGVNVSFDVREDEHTWSFRGTVSRALLKGTILHSLGGRRDVTLKRQCGYWDR